MSEIGTLPVDPSYLSAYTVVQCGVNFGGASETGKTNASSAAVQSGRSTPYSEEESLLTGAELMQKQQ